MDDTYCLKIEVEYPGQKKLIDLILDVEHNVEEAEAWVLTMDYCESYGDLPLFYISNFMDMLRGNFGDLQKIGITRDMISIWRCFNDSTEIFMEYWPEEMNLMASEGIKFRVLCRVLDEEEGGDSPHFGPFPIYN